MNTPKHTPGPWHISGPWIHTKADEPVASTSNYRNIIAGASRNECAESPRDDAEVQANARLMAASPEGIHAAESAYLFMLGLPFKQRTGLDAQMVLVRLRDYIAKATGRTERDVQDSYEAAATLGTELPQ